MKIHNILINITLFISSLLLCGCEKDKITDGRETGTVSLQLATDPKITLVTRAATDTTVAMPEKNDFRIRILTQEGKTVKEWPSYGNMPANFKIETGFYTMEADYGTQHTGAFAQPYFAGSAPFEISADQENRVQVTAILANVMATANYTQGFKNYFKDYTLKMKSGGAPLFFTKEETRKAYFEPGNLSVTLDLTKQDGSILSLTPVEMTGTKVGEYYRFNFDIEGGLGGEKLLISFDTTTTKNPITIPLPGDWMPSKAPYFTPKWDTEKTFPFLEGQSCDQPQTFYTLLTATGKIGSCIIRTTSKDLVKAGWPAEVNLARISNADRSTLLAWGVKWTETMKGANMAELDFTNIIPRLPLGEHNFTVELIDATTQTSGLLKLKISIEPPAFQLLPHEPVIIKSQNTGLKIKMSGGNPSNIAIKYYNSDWNSWSNAKVISVTELTNDTLLLSTDINFTAASIRVKATYGSRESEIEIATKNPQFVIQTAGLPWAKKTDIQIVQTDGANTMSANSLPSEYIVLQSRDGSWNNPIVLGKELNIVSGKAVVTAKALEPLKTYKLRVAYNAGIGNVYSNDIEVTTENIYDLPNTGFTQWNNLVFNKTIQKGGTQTYWDPGGFLGWGAGSKEKEALTGQLSVYNPDGWCTVNTKTVPVAAATQNIWYMVPSTLPSNAGSGHAVLIRNVAWHNNGPGISTNTASDKNGGGNQPILPTQFLRSVGKLFLGTYSATHDNANSSVSENYQEGTPFTSRPEAVQFDYTYIPDGTDIAIVKAALKAADGTVIATFEKRLDKKSAFYKQKCEFIYNDKTKQAAKLCLMFASSDKASASQTAENSVSTTIKGDFIYYGSQLTIDNLSFLYE